jgi:4a-hydroxytetrahydrobiopterin dehydratase
VNFDTYKSGLVFASAVGFIADKLDHHPDLLIGYKVVTITVSTHSEGGLTELDFHLACQVDALLT